MVGKVNDGGWEKCLYMYVLGSRVRAFFCGTFYFFWHDSSSGGGGGGSLCFTFTHTAVQLAYQFSSVLCDDISSGRACAFVRHISENLSSREQCFAAHNFGTAPKDVFDHPPESGEKTADPIAPLVGNG